MLLQAAPRSMVQDEEGVIRWQDDGSEVILFGANYCLPSASDYRAARRVSDDLKGMIDEDMQHFARMRWDGLRLSFWGDSENTDSAGNLMENEHLDLLCYLIYRARERGIYMLLSPIVNHTSLWPDAMDQQPQGIFAEFSGAERGVNPVAIAGQVNYIRQLLEYVNPYTGVALKDDPFIPFVEMVNEPYLHVDDFEGSVHYVNELVRAVKEVAPDKFTFHNLTQAIGFDPALRASDVDGASIGWYPSGLVAGRTLEGNFLRAVDDFPPVREADLTGLARVVYEFDQADLMSNVMYPAMTRTFRSLGVQFAAMFSYDMLQTSRYNLGWQTHFLNLVATPQKAISAMIAGEVMRELESGETYGRYPDNKVFGDFRLDYNQDLSEWVGGKRFYYTSNTLTEPQNVDGLEAVVGFGSSPVVAYSGRGVYFLDRIEEGVWRLEIHPDADLIADPYKTPSVERVVVDIRHREHLIRIDLPDLGRDFEIHDLGNSHESRATNSGGFTVTPGTYLLSSNPEFNQNDLPQFIGAVGMREFVTLEEIDFSDAPFHLFDPESDFDRLSYTRLLGEGRRIKLNNGDYSVQLGSRRLNERQRDFTASFEIVSKVEEIGRSIRNASYLQLKARSLEGSGSFIVTLMEADGSSWVHELALTHEWQSFDIPLSDFKAGKGVLLPQAYPGSWSYWVEPAKGRGGEGDSLNLEKLERIQFSIRNPGDGRSMSVEFGAVDLTM